MVQGRRQGASLILIIIAIVLFLLDAFGLTGKLGVDFLPLGLAAFAAAFIL